MPAAGSREECNAADGPFSAAVTARDEVALFEPQASYETSSPGRRDGEAAQTHDRRDDPVASHTGTISFTVAG